MHLTSLVCVLALGAPDPEPSALARQAHDILKTHCYRCHGQDGIAKAHEEEDKGKVDKPGYGLCHHGQVIGTFIHKHLDPGCLQRIARSLVDAHISPNPLLDERRKKCGR